MQSVQELIARGKVPSDTTPAHNVQGYPDGWPVIPDLAAQVKYDWDHLPTDRMRMLKNSNAEYRAAFETMVTASTAPAVGTDGGASEIPAAASAVPAGASPEDMIINAGNGEPPVPVAGDAAQEPVVPESQVPTPAPLEDETGTRYDIEYGYVEKTAEGWEVHIQVGDGGENVFRARTQKELIVALAKANAHATAKIRQQEQEREDAIANAEPDIAAPKRRLNPRALTADEQYEIAEAIASGDPSKVNKALAKRDEILFGAPASEVAAQIIATREEQEIAAYTATAKLFMRQNPTIVFSKELGDKIDAVLNENGWDYTVRNLNKVLTQLKQAGEVQEKVSTPPVEEPAIPVPTGAAAATPVPAAKPAAPAKPAAVATNQPAAGAPTKVEARLRPGSAATGISPRQASVRAGAVISEPSKVALTADEYNRMSVSDTRRKYATDRGFREAVDKLIAEGKI